MTCINTLLSFRFEVYVFEKPNHLELIISKIKKLSCSSFELPLYGLIWVIGRRVAYYEQRVVFERGRGYKFNPWQPQFLWREAITLL